MAHAGGSTFPRIHIQLYGGIYRRKFCTQNVMLLFLKVNRV